LGISFNERKGFSHPAKLMLGYLAQRVDGIRCHNVFDRHHILINIKPLVIFLSPITVVTNAPNVEVGKRVVVATEGAVVGDVTIKPTTVGGKKSEGMLLDSPNLGWKGGAAGKSRYFIIFFHSSLYTAAYRV